jgi:hypothetical protein
LDSVLVYDTYHSQPLAVFKGLHYANLTDAAWSSNGHQLLVSSTDGYISVISFAQGELGKVYEPPKAAVAATKPLKIEPTEVVLPPCEPEANNDTAAATIIHAPPQKKAKRIAPTLVSTSPSTSAPLSDTVVQSSNNNNNNNAAVDTTSQAVTKLSLVEQKETSTNSISNDQGGAEVEEPKKKKKRIQPMLVTN